MGQHLIHYVVPTSSLRIYMQLSLSLNPAPKCSYQPRTKKSYERLVRGVK